MCVCIGMIRNFVLVVAAAPGKPLNNTKYNSRENLKKALKAKTNMTTTAVSDIHTT